MTRGRIGCALVALALAAPGARALPARARCDFRHASDCARRELGVQGVVLPAILRTAVGMVPPDSAAKMTAVPSTVVDGCRTTATDPVAGTFTVTLDGCPAGAATLDGRITGAADVQFVGSVTGESGCAPLLSGAPFGTQCPVDTQVTAVADVAVTLVEPSGDRLQVACSSGPGLGIDAIVSIDVVVTKVPEGTPGALCFAVPGFCATFTAEPNVVALTGTCASRSTIGGRLAKKSVPIALGGFQFPVPAPGDVGCALAGQVVVTPARRVRIAASFDGDCVPTLEAARRHRRRALPAPDPLF